MEIALVNASLALLEILLPKIDGLVKTGQISVDEQAGVRAKYLALREAGDAAFTGPEWNQSSTA